MVPLDPLPAGDQWERRQGRRGLRTTQALASNRYYAAKNTPSTHRQEAAHGHHSKVPFRASDSSGQCLGTSETHYHQIAQSAARATLFSKRHRLSLGALI